MIVHTGFLHRFLFPSLIWSMPGKKIYLTFDDGPHPTATPAVLDVLRHHRVRATFFLSGMNIPGREQIVERIEREGHSIGIHSYLHQRRTAWSRQRTAEEIQKTQQLLNGIVRSPVRLYRPPFGFFTWNTVAAAKERECVLIMWSCLTGDFRSIPDDNVVANALHRLRGGSILVFHDNEHTESKIGPLLDRVMTEIQRRGFSFGAIR